MIKLRNVHKYFEGKSVLKGIDLDIYDGETITIIGGSGEGKSVLLKCIVGLLKVDKGEILIDGVDITKASDMELQKVQKNFGFLFQGAALFDSMTVYENVAFGIRRRNPSLSERDVRRIVEEKLSLVGLRGVEDLKPVALSGGMKKRVGLARAIATEPKYILYDEPTTGLDPVLADSINDLIIDMKEKLGVTSIVVTHDMHSACKVSDRIAMLYSGKIIEVGTPQDILNSKNALVRNFIKGVVI